METKEVYPRCRQIVLAYGLRLWMMGIGLKELITAENDQDASNTLISIERKGPEGMIDS